MLISAFTGVVVSALTKSAWIGLLAGMAAGSLIGVLLGYFHLKLKTNVILAGIAFNLLAAEGTVFLLYVVAHDKGVSSSLASKVIPEWQIPVIKDIPVLEPFLASRMLLRIWPLLL